jgi:hypothetical protein
LWQAFEIVEGIRAEAGVRVKRKSLGSEGAEMMSG